MISHKKKIAYLTASDRVLGAAIARIAVPDHSWDSKRANHFKALVVAIVNQQLSGKAAATILKRLVALFASAGRAAPKTGSKKFSKPEDVLKMSTAKMRRSGLSGMKVKFLKDLARRVANKSLNFRKIAALGDEEVIVALTAVKGIGRWTAEMFLMFSLQRDDVFSYGDLGLRNAIRKLYGLRAHPTPAQAARISAAWKPYRTLASRYLWASLEKKEE